MEKLRRGEPLRFSRVSPGLRWTPILHPGPGGGVMGTYLYYSSCVLRYAVCRYPRSSASLLCLYEMFQSNSVIQVQVDATSSTGLETR